MVSLVILPNSLVKPLAHEKRHPKVPFLLWVSAKLTASPRQRCASSYSLSSKPQMAASAAVAAAFTFKRQACNNGSV